MTDKGLCTGMTDEEIIPPRAVADKKSCERGGRDAGGFPEICRKPKKAHERGTYKSVAYTRHDKLFKKRVYEFMVQKDRSADRGTDVRYPRKERGILRRADPSFKIPHGDTPVLLRGYERRGNLAVSFHEPVNR